MAICQYLRVLCLALLGSMAAATQFRVGGSRGWSVSTDPNSMSYNQWAERNRFHIGDSLLFVYHPDQDSVLLVGPDAYKTCNTSSFIDEFKDGNTVFPLTRPGPFYFISGNRENCLKNESLVAVVMADRSNATSPSLPPSPSEATSPPTPGSIEVTPTTSPAGESTPPNGASLKMVSLVSSVVALIGSAYSVL